MQLDDDFEMPESNDSSDKKSRPFVVPLVAIIQFARGGALAAFILWRVWHLAGLNGDTAADPYAPLRKDPFLAFVPVLIVYFIAVGFAILCLQSWARHVLVITNGLTVAVWARNVAVGGLINGMPFLKGSLTPNLTLASILVDVLVICCLLLYPDVAKAFNDQS
jgi:hypothetical protein